MWTKVCTFETQTNIGVTETQCRTEPEVKTCLTRFAMCKYPNRIQKNPHQTLIISKWGQFHTSKEPKYDRTPESSYMSQTIEDYSISSIYSDNNILLLRILEKNLTRDYYQSVRNTVRNKSYKTAALVWSIQTWIIIRHVNFQM